MSEEFFIVRGVRAAVFVGVANRPALPVLSLVQIDNIVAADVADGLGKRRPALFLGVRRPVRAEGRSEEHTSELQSRSDLVCRLLLEKKKNSRGPRLVQADGISETRT